ncbi:MAG TPA: malto-oligosyltrehalose synthase [Acidimicrobiales bacterium]|nr:malto-oligosyltrehalose synthase [Acidimicrobiales bacterium]
MTLPRATYRLQLRPGFGFDEAAAVATYLADLGVSHAYVSPYLQAAPGSTHGYDVVDHSSVNEELGGEEAHARFCSALGDVGLGQVLDIVPNHMAITSGNAWWTDVLENGPASRYAGHFDVDWDPPEAKLRNTVLMPVLGDHYGRVLEAGELGLERRGGGFWITYLDHAFPLAPRSYDTILAMAAIRSGSDEMAFLADAFARLPLATATAPELVASRHRDKEVLKGWLARLCEEQPQMAAAVDEVVSAVKGDPDLLDALLDRQNHRLAHWRTAGEELDYRRFFDITTLAGLRVEDEHVFADTHARVLRWLADGVIDGLRIDHPDGMRDPEGYVRRLREAAPEGWIVVEKILEPGEALPTTWPVDGTTGYDFLNRLGGVLVDAGGIGPLTDAYAGFTGEATDYAEIVHANKHLVLREVLAADVNRLTHLFVQVCEAQRRYRDFTRSELSDVLVETIACVGVYRTYVRPDGSRSDADEVVIADALAAAAERRPDLDEALFELLGRLLRGRAGDAPAALELMARFQQTTGPVMAKGVEDTTFYTYNRLIALNEVGGDPGHVPGDVSGFHRQMAEAQERWPAAMLTSSTHDTKRSEDVRARIALLSEIPEDFAAAVRRWSDVNERHRSGDLPDRNVEWLLYQTLVGAHPLPADRALAYVEKATREAKVHTSWTDPDPSYDEAVRAFTEGILGDEAFTADLAAFVAPLVEPGWVTALTAQLVKLTAPGVPDVYQGTELWDLSLVDPDNRRPVDYDVRRRLLREIDGLEAEGMWDRLDEGLPKLALTRAALGVRSRLREAFGAGAAGRYEALVAVGPAAGHLLGFVRGGRVATLAPRLVLGLRDRGGWDDTTTVLPEGTWTDAVTGAEMKGGTVSVAEALGRFPVALLVQGDDDANGAR